MFIARWQIDSRFGHKQKLIDHLRAWERDIGSKAGMEKMQARYLTGSIGAREATVELNLSVASLAELEQFFDRIGQLDAHKKWGQEAESCVVSGTSHWQIYRVL